MYFLLFVSFGREKGFSKFNKEERIFLVVVFFFVRVGIKTGGFF